LFLKRNLGAASDIQSGPSIHSPVDVPEAIMHSFRPLFLMMSFLMLTLIEGCATSRQSSGQNAIRVMSYNIHHGVGSDSVFDVERIASVIRRSDADVVALQDVDRWIDRTGKMDMMTKLADLTGMTYTFGKSTNVDGGEHGNGLLTRFPILEERLLTYRLQLSDQNYSLMRLVLDVRGTEIVFLNTELHGDGNDSLQTENVAEIVAASTEHQNVPIILSGSVNSVPDSKSLAAIKTVFRDSWTMCGSGDGFTFPSNAPEKRVDYIFISNRHGSSDSKSIEVSLKPVEATVPVSNASDHLPLVITLKVVSE
jgi:endonuclease/exonuclease/phosphatase family metal-dependent hydrolase